LSDARSQEVAGGSGAHAPAFGNVAAVKNDPDDAAPGEA
jgi:hypothetical protein